MSIFDALFKPNVEKMEKEKNIIGLIKALKYRNADISVEAAYALGKIGDKSAVESLIEALGRDDNFVRNAAAVALGKIGDYRAVEPLKELLLEKDLWVRQLATEAQNRQQLGWDTYMWGAQLAFILMMIKNVVNALRQIGDKGAFAPLIIVLGTCDNSVRLVRILKKRDVIEKESDLIEMTNSIRVSIAQCLIDINDSRAIEPLNELLKCEDNEVQRVASEALKKIST
jgi:HEAT repeat protein